MLQGMPWQRVPVTDNWIILNPERAGNCQLSVRVENNEGKYSMSDSVTVIVRGTLITRWKCTLEKFPIKGELINNHIKMHDVLKIKIISWNFYINFIGASCMWNIWIIWHHQSSISLASYIWICVYCLLFFPVEIIHSKLLKLHIIARHFMTPINEVLVTEYARCIYSDRVHLLIINMHWDNKSHFYLS